MLTFIPNVETKRQSVENELQVLKAKKSDYDAEIKSLNDKIETLQSSNRTNLSIIESNNKRDQTITEELTKQHQRNVELAREITTLQQSEQNARGQLNSAKYREESLQLRMGGRPQWPLPLLRGRDRPLSRPHLRSAAGPAGYGGTR